MQILQWQDHFSGDPSEDTLRRQFSKELYRVSRSVYRPGLRFSGVMGPGTCHVLQGACRYTFKGETVTLHAGEFCHTPGGDYDFEVVGAGEALVVKIWSIPDMFARAGVPWPGPGAGTASGPGGSNDSAGDTGRGAPGGPATTGTGRGTGD